MRLLLSAALTLLSAEPPLDPGAAAFGRGLQSLAAGDPADAELEFARCLDDGAIPPARRARALYNRGTARTLVGTTSGELAAACEDLRDCLTSAESPGELHADARNNLEVAKLLLAQARAREARRPPRPESQDSANPRQTSDDGREAPPRPMTVLTPVPGATPPAPQAGGEPGANDGPPGKATRPPAPSPAVDPPPVTAAEARVALAEARARIARGHSAAAKLRPASGGGNALDW